MKRLVVCCAAILALAPPVEAGRWRLPVEPNHSSIGFEVPIAGGMTRVRGFFKSFEIEVIWDDRGPEHSAVTATIAVASIDTGIDGRDADLQGEAFFDAARHPEILFASRRIERRGDAWVALGELTIRGVSRPIELEFALTDQRTEQGGEPTIGVMARAVVDRQQFGVGSDWRHSAIPGFIGDEISIAIDFWTRPGAPLADE